MHTNMHARTDTHTYACTHTNTRLPLKHRHAAPGPQDQLGRTSAHTDAYAHAHVHTSHAHTSAGSTLASLTPSHTRRTPVGSSGGAAADDITDANGISDSDGETSESSEWY